LPWRIQSGWPKQNDERQRENGLNRYQFPVTDFVKSQSGVSQIHLGGEFSVEVLRRCAKLSLKGALTPFMKL